MMLLPLSVSCREHVGKRRSRVETHRQAQKLDVQAEEGQGSAIARNESNNS